MFREKVGHRLKEHKRWEEEKKRKIEAGEVFCKACGTTVTEKQTYCPKCGNFLVGDEKVKSSKKTSPKKQKTGKKGKEDLFKGIRLFEDKKHKKEHDIKKHEKHPKKEASPAELLFFVFAVFLVIAGVILLPTKVVSYQVQVPYTSTETYTEEVPYEDIEEYTVRVPYQVDEEYVESVPYEVEEPYQKCFIVCWTAYRTVTKYKDVIKTRTVTKYRDETRYRKVTKTRTETREKEVLKYRTETKYKEVNWIFGFDALIKWRALF